MAALEGIKLLQTIGETGGRADNQALYKVVPPPRSSCCLLGC
jgi:hypothetical protein